MDGVPFLTQPYVYTGDSFDYRLTPPDAGTFWYHPHCNTLTQMGRGLTGMLIVEDPKDPQFDAELAINLRDWRLGGNGQFIEQFKAATRQKKMAIRYRAWRKLAGSTSYEAPAGGLVRLRLVASDVTRIYQLRMDGADADVIAIDGQPVPTRFRLQTIVIGPGQRLDLAVRMPDVEGSVVSLIDTRPSTAKTVANFTTRGTSLKHDLAELGALAANPCRSRISKMRSKSRSFSAQRQKEVQRNHSAVRWVTTFWAINRVPWRETPQIRPHRSPS